MGMIYAPPSIIPNGALINDVCHIYQNIKPTARLDGSALVVRDKWYNTDTGVEGFWNGTYWLGRTFDLKTGGGSYLVAHSILQLTGKPNIFESSVNVFVESITGYFRLTLSGTYDSNNYWRVAPIYEIDRGLNETQSTLGIISYQNIDTNINNTAKLVFPINIYYNNGYIWSNPRCWTLVVGNPSPVLWVGNKVIYREVL